MNVAFGWCEAFLRVVMLIWFAVVLPIQAWKHVDYWCGSMVGGVHAAYSIFLLSYLVLGIWRRL